MNKAKSYGSKPERKNSAKIVALILCLFVLLALGLSIAGNVIMFNKLKATALTEPEAENAGVIVTPQEPGEDPAPLSLSSGIATVAADDVTSVPVTVTSSNPDERITWSIAFNNPDSTWATGKTVTDYVTVTPTSDGALTATVSVSQEFQEQIIVTATSRIDTTASVSCTVDYKDRYKLAGGYSIEYTENESSFNGYETTFRAGCMSTAVGTIRDNPYRLSVDIQFESNGISDLKNFFKNQIVPQFGEIFRPPYLDNLQQSLHTYGSSNTNQLTLTSMPIYIDNEYAFPARADDSNIHIHTYRFFGYFTETKDSPYGQFKNALNSFVSGGGRERLFSLNTAINSGLDYIASNNSNVTVVNDNFYLFIGAVRIDYTVRNDQGNILVSKQEYRHLIIPKLPTA